MNWRVLIPLIPLLVLNAVFILGLPVFALKVRREGLPHDERTETRTSGLIGRYLQLYLLWLIGPVERLLVRMRVAPDALTAFSLFLSLCAGVALGMGHMGRGGWLYIFTGITDIFDGRVARATNRVSTAGAFADSVGDRVAEAAIFSGLAWYYRGTWVLGLVLLALATSFMVSYTRARGESLGISGADVGRMQRPERILFLGLGTVFSPVTAVFLPKPTLHMHWPVIVALGLIAFASLGTALRRFALVYRTLRNREAPPVRALRPVSTAKAATKTVAPPPPEPTPVTIASPR